MASRTASVAPSAASPRRQGEERPESVAPELDVLDRRHLVARAHRRQARVLMTLAALCLAGSLVLAALGHALVASDQVRSDALQSQIAQALQVQQDYQLQKAELVAPARILAIATTGLHMVTPKAVTYLTPVNPGESVAQAHEPATVSPAAHGGAARSAGSPGNSTNASHAP